MDERVLEQVADLIEDHTGLRSPPTNRAHLRRALDKQARRAGMTAEALAGRIRHDESARQDLLNAVMIGETYFFREAGQFRLLRRELLPTIVRDRRRVSCWSVSCSTGEEAVSLAVLLDDLGRETAGLDYRVVASDINSASLERLRVGTFPRSSLRGDGSEFHALLLDRHVVESTERSLTLSDSLRGRIAVHHINFFRDDLAKVPDQLDVIFFRNTLLYAPQERRNSIIARIVTRMRPGGFLFLATSEIPFVSHPELIVRDYGGVYALQRTESNGGVGGAGRTVAGVSSVGSSKRDTTDNARKAPAHQKRPAASESRSAQPTGGAGPAVTSEEILKLLNRADQPGSPLAPDHPDVPDAAVVVARLVMECFEAVNEEQLDRAATKADELYAAAGETAVALYCGAWVHYTDGDRDQAIPLFDRVLAMDDLFWPARFYRTSLVAGALTDVGACRRAKREYHRCISAIDRYDSLGESDRFAFLLEGFSATYFRRMCARWIEKITDKESTSCR